MKKENLQKLSLEELKQKEKSLNTINWLTVGMLILLFGIGIYMSIRRSDFDMSIVISIAMMPIVIINFNNLKALRKEIARR